MSIYRYLLWSKDERVSEIASTRRYYTIWGSAVRCRRPSQGTAYPAVLWPRRECKTVPTVNGSWAERKVHGRNGDIRDPSCPWQFLLEIMYPFSPRATRDAPMNPSRSLLRDPAFAAKSKPSSKSPEGYDQLKLSPPSYPESVQLGANMSKEGVS